MFYNTLGHPSPYVVGASPKQGFPTCKNKAATVGSNRKQMSSSMSISSNLLLPQPRRVVRIQALGLRLKELRTLHERIRATVPICSREVANINRMASWEGDAVLAKASPWLLPWSRRPVGTKAFNKNQQSTCARHLFLQSIRRTPLENV